MRLLVIARPAGSASTERILLEGARRGHACTAIDPLGVVSRMEGGRAVLEDLDGRPVEADVVLTRAGTAFPREVTALARHAALAGMRLVQDPDAVDRANDQWETLQALAGAGLPFPPTWLFRSTDAAPRALEALGVPAVVKTLRGSGGDGVVLAESALALETLLDTYLGMGKPVLVQRYVRESAGRDIRALVVAGRTVACMRRFAPPGSFRANLHRGGRGEALMPPPAEIARLAEEAASAVGLTLCGVDLVESDDGALVLEVNATPGFARIADVTGVDIAGEVLDAVLPG